MYLQFDVRVAREGEVQVEVFYRTSSLQCKGVYPHCQGLPSLCTLDSHVGRRRKEKRRWRKRKKERRKKGRGTNEGTRREEGGGREEGGRERGKEGGRLREELVTNYSDSQVSTLLLRSPIMGHSLERVS